VVYNDVCEQYVVTTVSISGTFRNANENDVEGDDAESRYRAYNELSAPTRRRRYRSTGEKNYFRWMDGTAASLGDEKLRRVLR